MTKKKYIIKWVIFFILFFIVCASFLTTFILKLQNVDEVLIFLICALFFLIVTIFYYITNRKHFKEYEITKVYNKYSNITFEVEKIDVNFETIKNNLLDNKFIRRTNNYYKKVYEDNNGDACITIVTNVFVFENTNFDEIYDIVINSIEKNLTDINIVYIFLDNFNEVQRKKVLDYIKENVIDVELHTYRFKKYFCPIVISNNEVFYYSKVSFGNNYKTHIKNGINYLSKESR
ncbi:MAG TPA: hypothetical protein DCR62_02625 [Acholeplasmatales bacterium]|nr:hypothetical protein [Acholeplasmatales bacterium]